MTVGELAQKVRGAVEGDQDAVIQGVSTIEDAENGDIVFAENSRFLSKAEKSRASAIVAFLDATAPDKPLIKVENPRYAFAKILELFAPNLRVTPGIHPTAVVEEGCTIGEGASIGAHVFVGRNVSIGPRTAVMPGCFVGDNCILGENCILYPNVTVRHNCVLGNRVYVHSGTVIGADGFGYMRIGDDSVKVPQVGNVEIDDDVEIGANCTIDRAKTGSTIIGPRTKIDNLAHIAHNVKVGPDCIVVAQVGVAGSTELGRGVMIAGQAGLKDHIKVGDGAVIMGQAGVFGNVEPGEIVSGYPARQHKESLRQSAALSSLPEYVKRIRQLEKDNRDLHDKADRLEKAFEILTARLGSTVEP
jgi:UDP-3-O-[3-hydroxymyristoyl] glucosamine N-acyltransferase